MDVSLTLLAIMFGNKFVSESKKEKKKKNIGGSPYLSNDIPKFI